MNKTEMFDAHVLAEVRPLVRSMPEQQYVAQTNGSARMRVSKFEDGRYRVRGIPGHTHNSTAICSVEADFTKMRLVDLAVAPTFRYTDEEKYNAGDFTESEHFVAADEVEIYDRAIEKGIGNIRLVPENCHQEIDEPTRAIAEIRTIVSSKQQLDSLTYIDEMGSHVDAITGYDATDVFDGQCQSTYWACGAQCPMCRQTATQSLASYLQTRTIFCGAYSQFPTTMALTQTLAHCGTARAFLSGTRTTSSTSHRHSA
jgi:hypothetical protein